jgi:hypothetical protein
MSFSTEHAGAGRALARHLVLALLLLLGAALGATDPAPIPENPHGAFREDCGLCHGAGGWKPARVSRRFNHAKYGFALEGAHAAANCLACHASLEFKRPEKLCASCHEDPHRGEMGPDCARCHGARSFVDRAAMLRAHQLTHFPLTGSHAGLECERCHPPAEQGRLQFVATEAECRACHLDAYRSTRDPDHAAAGFSLECQTCHTTLSWTRARFDHSASGFPLTGAHRQTPCQSCHGDGVWAGKSTACVSCHQQDYNGTTNPAHAASGFPTTCQSCHSTTNWSGATFDHSSTGFPLTGAHLQTPCLSCHGDGVWAGKSTACVSCHQQNYDATTNPAHAAAGFPTTCQSCHNTTSWAGATFDHDTNNFPIYSGRHAGLWSACSTCHTSSSNYAVFTCFNCHPHDDQAGTASHHSGISGYRYDSQACYACHPRGRS